MVTKKLVLNFDLGGGVKVDTYILLYKDKPILAPNLYLFKMAKSGFLISAIKTYSDCLKKFFNVLSCNLSGSIPVPGLIASEPASSNE